MKVYNPRKCLEARAVEINFAVSFVKLDARARQLTDFDHFTYDTADFCIWVDVRNSWDTRAFSLPTGRAVD